MAGTPEVKVHISADIAELKANLAALDREVRRASQSAQRELGGLSAAFNGVKGGIAGLAAALVSAGTIGTAKAWLDAAGGIGELADQIGIGTQALQELEYGALQSGMGIEDLHGSMAKLTARIGEAAAGGDDAIKAFDALGVKILDAAGNTRATEAVLRDVANGYAAMGDKARAAAAIKEIFGRSGQKLIPILKEGADGLDRMAASARQSGAVLSDDLISAADTASDRIVAMERAASKAGETFMAKLAPSISAFMDALRVGMGGATFGEKIAEQMRLVEEAERILQKTHERSDWMYGFRGKESSIQSAEQNLSSQRAALAALQAQADQAAAQVRDRATGESTPGMSNPTPNSAGTKAESAAAQHAKQVAKLTAELENQAAAFERTSQQKAVYDALSRANVETDSLLVTQTGQVVGALTAEEETLARVAVMAEQAKAAEEARRAAIDRLAKAEAEAWDQALRATEAREKITAGMGDEVAQNRVLLAALADSEAAYERAKAMMDALNEARRAGIELTPDELAGLEANAATLGDQRAEMERLKETHAEASRAQADMTRAIGTAAEDAILRAQSLRQVLAGVLQDIARIALRAAVTKPLEGMFGSLFSSFGGAGFSNITTAFKYDTNIGSQQTQMLAAQDAGFSAFADGGRVVGPGGPRSDSILAAVSNGEFIVNAASASRNLALLEAINAGRLPRFADGGLVGGGMTVPAMRVPRLAVPDLRPSQPAEGRPQVTNHFIIDARGADRDGLARLEQRIAQINGSIERRAIAATAEQVRRGGAARKAIRG